jgi:catechol 2,3-dioxygenase-like lactoylglutathione lyase family enzyme
LREETAMNQMRLDHVSLLVRNLETSCAFYRDVLMLPEIPSKIGVPYIRWFAIGTGHSVHLIEGDFGDTKVRRSTHFCISTSGYEEFKTHLQTRGIVWCNSLGVAGAENLRALDGVRQLYFQDPDGYWIEFNNDC